MMIQKENHESLKKVFSGSPNRAKIVAVHLLLEAVKQET